MDQFRSFREIVPGLPLLLVLDPTKKTGTAEFRVEVLRASQAGGVVDAAWVQECLAKQDAASKAFKELNVQKDTPFTEKVIEAMTALAESKKAVNDALNVVFSEELQEQRMRARLPLAKQAVRGLMELHEFAGIAHRQLDPRNITVVSSFFVTNKHKELPKLPPAADLARLLEKNFMATTGGPNRDKMPPPQQVRLVYDNIEYGRMLREESNTYWREKEQTADFPIKHALLQHWFGPLDKAKLEYVDETASWTLTCSDDVNEFDPKTQDMFGLFLVIWQILAAVSFESQYKLKDGEEELHQLLARHFLRWCTSVRQTHRLM